MGRQFADPGQVEEPRKIVEHPIYVYKEQNWGPNEKHPNVHYMDAPLLDISATYIRDCLQQGLSIEYLGTRPGVGIPFKQQNLPIKHS